MQKKTVRKKQSRNEKGNFYVLYIGLAAAIIVAWNIYATIGMSYIVSYRSKCALEAASLAAARDLSRIVVDDPKWGYVSLTDQPPVGDDTRASDGYPLPVTGINTILATARLELIVAHSIGTNEAIECAMSDVRSAKAASRRLARALRNSLRNTRGGNAVSAYSDNIASRATGTTASPTTANTGLTWVGDEDLIARDIHGKEVRPMVAAADIYRKNATDLLNGLGWELQGVSGELGSLESEGTTNTPVPGSSIEAHIDDSLVGGGSLFSDKQLYPAFVNVPAFEEDFNFAGLGKQASLVETPLFEKYSSANTCSVVRLVAQLKKKDGSAYIKSAACAQPAYMEDKVPASYMVLRFPNGLPSGVTSIRELLTSEGLAAKIPLYTARGGDFPTDQGSALQANPEKPTATVKETFTRAFFDWLRTAHAKPKVESVLTALDYPFNRQEVTATYLYTFNNQGQAEVYAPNNYPFTSQATYENQLYSVAFNAINARGVTWTLRMRDQVHRLGKLEGGKHAGQPMPSTVAVDPNQEEGKRMLDKAGSRYDRSRLGLEIEISSPTIASGDTQ